jgi:hypothetical protein
VRRSTWSLAIVAGRSGVEEFLEWMRVPQGRLLSFKD